VIHELKGKYPIVLLCKLAGVSKSGYYKWARTRENPTTKQIEDEFIISKIIECHDDPDINGSFGYLRVKAWLKREYGLIVNHKRVYRLMKVSGILAKIRVKKWKYFGRKAPYVISDNHLNREFSTNQPNKKWVTDVTYLIFNGKRLYLSVIQDLYNNEIVSYQISERNDLKLVLDTVKKATKKREVTGLLLHSDQGYQYTSKRYNLTLKRYNIKISMSRKGNCLDNACVESFFSHFKSECFYRYQFMEQKQVEHAVKRYIWYYNKKRFQRKLNNLSPLEYRAKAA
jgi:transposase InsO family protein